MARKGITKKKVKQVIRLLDNGYSYSETSAIAQVSWSMVNQCATANRCGLEFPVEYNDLIARRAGFESSCHYVHCRKIARGEGEDLNIDFPTRQNDFEKSFERYGSFRRIKRYASPNDMPEFEKEETQEAIAIKLYEALSQLSEVEKEIIFHRFYGGKTLKQTHSLMGFKCKKSKASSIVSERQGRIIGKLRKIVKRIGLDDFFYEK